MVKPYHMTACPYSLWKYIGNKNSMIVITEFMDEQALTGLSDKGLQYTYNPDLWEDTHTLYAMLADADGIIVRNKTQVNQALLDAAPKLKVVGRLGVGLDNIDMEACAERDVTVCPALGANADSVAEFVIASIFILLRGAYMSQASMLAGEWPRNALMGYEVQGKTLGLVGFGSIAREVSKRAQALGMTIVAYDPFVPADSDLWTGVESLSLEACLQTSDVVSLHLPFTPETRHIINANTLATMKQGSILINSSRGETVDAGAVADAMKSGHLLGASLDVFEQEPLSAEGAKIFAGIDNLILTPHIAGITVEANERVSYITVENVLKHV